MAPDDKSLGAADTVAVDDETAWSLDTPRAGDSVHQPISTGVIANRYAILGLLGAGGMGRVYRAHDRTLDEDVALKILRSDGSTSAIERFRQEVKLARRVTSPHVVRTFDVGEHGHDHFLTMELVDGRSLGRILDEGRPVGDEVMRISRGTAAGMAAAHAAGVTHRDLKPDNILVAHDGRIAITDFGIATTAAETTGGFVGTPAYMAPEQVRGDTTIGPPADVYAFGAILYEMTTGHRAFPGHELLAVATARLSGDPPDPRRVRANVPAVIADVVMRCMALDPARRFATGAELATALAAIDIRNAPAATPTIVPIVPHRTSRAIAVLPLRAPPELAELADGLAEEIVDALSMTRELRVRPLVSTRVVHRADADPTATGKALGVEVVVDGTLRRVGDTIRVSARAIGVADGFQLWANRFDAKPEAILGIADDIARRVAAALAVTIDVPMRAEMDPRAADLFLQGKAGMRAHWMTGRVGEAAAALHEASLLAPNDPNIEAALAMALARLAFIGRGDKLGIACDLAKRAVAAASNDGETWCALAITQLYSGEIARAAGAAARAVELAPGNALAQAMLGSLLLEAGMMDEALAHLEGAASLDPGHQFGSSDLARAYFYEGRYDDCFALLEATMQQSPLAPLTLGRLQFWRGVPYDGAEFQSAHIKDAPADFQINSRLAFEFVRHRRITPAQMAEFATTLEPASARLRAARKQFAVEFYAAEHPELALDLLAGAIDAGFHDYQWILSCPVIEPIRSTPRFAALAAIVKARAESVIAAVLRIHA